MKWAGSRTQAFRFSAELATAPDADRAAAHQVREIRTVPTVPHRSADGVAVQAGRGLEDPAALGGASGGGVGLRPLGRDPALEVLGRIDDDSQKHLRVLRPAELGALPQVHPGQPGIDPRRVDLVRDQVGLPRETGDPEAVRHVGGEEGQKRGRGMGGIADRQVQLVGRDDPERGIAELPPPLPADDRDLQSAGRLGPILDLEDRPGGRQPEDDHDQDRDHRPRHLDLEAAVDLGRLGVVVAGPTPETDHGHGEQREDDQEDRSRDAEDEEGVPVDLLGVGRERREDAGAARRPAEARCGPRREREPRDGGERHPGDGRSSRKLRGSYRRGRDTARRAMLV